jgi:hypothetical protein
MPIEALLETDRAAHRSPPKTATQSLTEAGKRTDPFTLQYIAGHDNIKDDCALCSPPPMLGKQFPLRGERKRRVGAKSGAVAIAPHRLPR